MRVRDLGELTIYSGEEKQANRKTVFRSIVEPLIVNHKTEHRAFRFEHAKEKKGQSRWRITI